MENLLFLGVPILRHFRVHLGSLLRVKLYETLAKEITLKGQNLVLDEQILSLKS